MPTHDATSARPIPDLVLLNRLLAQALELAPDERGAWLAALAPGDSVLRATLRHLLDQADASQTGDLLGTLPKLDRGSHTDPDHSAGEQVGPYRLLRPLGQGGMGAVWLAERSDGELKRPVALKLPLIATHPLMRQRLERERDILSRLVHPHIARLYDAGVDTAGGQPFLALEYVDGQAIDAHCAAHRVGLQARLGLFLQVARAVAYAHANLVLHRDLKPANILVAADGQVRLLDFGIAKLLEDGDTHASELTQMAGRALTPDYASPEQVLGHSLTVASDVYALGVVLCELLCGQRPYRLQRDSRAALEDAILSLEPSAPSTLTPERALKRQLSGDLDTIVLKALKKDPAARYPTANAMADDIERCLAGRPVLARPDSHWYRAGKFVRRNRLAVGATAAVTASLLAGSAVAWSEARLARLEARKAQAVQSFMTDVFLANTHEQPDPQRAQATTARELLASGTRKIETALNDAPEAKAEVLRTFGRLLMEFGLDDEATKLERQRVALLRTLLAPNDPRLADALLGLSDAMDSAAERSDRPAVLEEARRIIESQSHPDRALQGELHFQLAELMQYRDWPASARHAKQAAELFTALGNNAKLVQALDLQGTAADEMGDMEAAERSLAQGVRIAQALPTRPRFLPQILMQLAAVQGERMEMADADRNFRAAIDSAQQIYGSDHDVYVDTLVDYGTYLAQAARAKEALPFLRQAAAIHLRIKGENETFHLPKTLTMLGIVLTDYGRPEEGAPWLERVVKLKQQQAPDLAVAAFLHLAARGESEAGHMARATELLDEATRIIGTDAAHNAQDIATRNRIERAHLALRSGQAAQALALLAGAGLVRGAVPGTRSELGEKVLVAEAQAGSSEWGAAAITVATCRLAIERLHLGAAAARENARLDVVEGRVLLARRNGAEASVVLRRALATRRSILDPQAPLVGEALALLARARRLAGDPGDAAQLARQARDLLSSHPSLPPILAHLR